MTQPKRKNKLAEHIGNAVAVAFGMTLFIALACVCYWLIRWAIGW